MLPELTQPQPVNAELPVFLFGLNMVGITAGDEPVSFFLIEAIVKNYGCGKS